MTAASGGLFLLIVINKLLISPKIATIAALGGAAYFLAYLLEWLTPAEDENGEMLKGLKSLVFVGIFTLLATRLFGMLGLCLVAPVRQWLESPALRKRSESSLPRVFCCKDLFLCLQSKCHRHQHNACVFLCRNVRWFAVDVRCQLAVQRN